MSEQLTIEELEMAAKVGRTIGSRWSAVDPEDVTAELYLWLLKNMRAVLRWRGEDSIGRAKLYVTLKREAAKYCAHEQAQMNGAPLRQDRTYTVAVLDRALPFLFEDVPQTTVHEHPRTGQPLDVPHEHNLAVSVMADIRSEFYGLDKSLRHTLELRYRDGLTYEEIGPLVGLTKDGALKRVQRGLSRLSDALGG